MLTSTVSRDLRTACSAAAVGVMLKGTMEILINWEVISSEESFFDVFLPQVEAPEWHGRNLNALADSIITGSINNIEPPYTIKSINTSKAPESIKDFQLKVLNIFTEAVTESRDIKVTFE